MVPRRARQVLLCALALAAANAAAASITHRVWLASTTPADTLAALRSGGVDGFVVPVGRAVVSTGATTFTSEGRVDLPPEAPAPVSIAVWVEGEGQARGNAASFWGQLGPSARGLGEGATVVLITRRFWEGLPAFANALAKEAGRRVELALPATELASAAPRGGWPDLGLVALALGRPHALGFETSLPDDDLFALDALDERGVEYRAALIVMPHIDPAPGGQPLNLRPLASPLVASFRAGRGDTFTLHRAVEWGGETVGPGTTLEIEATTTARYARDLGLLMRPTRTGLVGWDTLSLPDPEPTAGMSREAFLDFLGGGGPYPIPALGTRWLDSTRLEVSISNTSPHGTAAGTLRNWVEVRYEGTEIRDVQLGDFLSLEYGVPSPGGWRATDAPRSADAVRLLFLFLAPRHHLGGAVITFMVPPRGVRVRWSVLPGDGGVVVGPLESVSSVGR